MDNDRTNRYHRGTGIMPSLSTRIQKRLFAILAAILLVVLSGSTGYYILFGGEPNFMDCLINAPSSTTLTEGTTLMVMGNVETIKKVRDMA